MAALAGGLLALSPGSVRAEDAAKPLTIDAAGLVDTMAVVSGGTTHGTRVLARADVRVQYDGTASNVPWLTAQFDGAAINGKSISALAGDAQGVSNIEFDRALRVVNAWVQASSAHVALKLGIIDSNLDFDEQNVGATFVHASHGMGPELSGAGLDGAGSSPDTTLGAIVSVFDAEAGWKLRAGVFKGRPGDPAQPGHASFSFEPGDGALLIGEADWTRSWGRIAVGGWHFTSTIPALDGSGDRKGASGGFVTPDRSQGWPPAQGLDARCNR